MSYDYRIMLRAGKILSVSCPLKFRDLAELIDTGVGCYVFKDKQGRQVVLKVAEIVGFRVEKMS